MSVSTVDDLVWDGLFRTGKGGHDSNNYLGTKSKDL